MTGHDYDLYRRNIPPEIIAYIPSEWAHYWRVIPIELGKMDFVVAMPYDQLPDLELMRFMLNRPDVEIVQVSPEAFQFALDRYYPRQPPHDPRP